MKNKSTGYNYSTNSRNVQVYISEEFAEKIIAANDSVRLIDKIVDEMDLRSLFNTYSHYGRKPRTAIATMLKILIYANMEGIYSSRAIEEACKRDINFIWLLNGEEAPSYKQVASFRSERLALCSEELFYDLVRKLHEAGEIKFEHLFVDGTKIEANANKYSFVWKKSTTKYETRLLEKLCKRTREIAESYGLMSVSAEELLSILENSFNGEYVCGRGKRKTQKQKDIEELRQLLAKRVKYSKYQEIFKGRNSFSKTDPDATFMHMKEDHMNNSQLKPGYNLQFGVEGEYITGVSISSERSDQLCLIPLLDEMREYTGESYVDVTADAGYESEENYTYFENSPTQCYIKPQNYERSKTRKYKSNMALRENMEYDAENDEYICQANRRLTVRYTGTRKSKNGFESVVTYYECESCEGCPHRKKCTKSKGNRKLQVSKKFVEQRKASLERITSDKGILLRKNRSIQSEGAFGVVKQNYGFRQFLLRGNRKVKTEILLLAMAYNINKYHAKIQQNRTGKQLFEKLRA